MLSRDQLAARIDHTLLRPDATPSEIDTLCRDACDNGIYAVCVPPRYVSRARDTLAGLDAGPRICTVIGFPSGAHHPAVKAFEAAQAVRDGADELDMVIALGPLRDRDDASVLSDIQGVVEAADGRVVKVILEVSLLTPQAIKRACKLAVKGGARFVKTSTGFSGGATVEDVALMREIVGPEFGVKASGGIRTAAEAAAMIEAGANRIGASRSIAILHAWGPHS